MDKKITPINKATIKAKFKEVKDSAVNGAKATLNWCVENPLLAVTILGSAASLGNKTYKAMKLHDENIRRRRTFYDPRKGRYSEVRRDLRGYELDEIDARYDAGESYNHILMDMGLLK